MSDKERLNEFIEAEKQEDNSNIEVANLSETVKKSFLEYAMSVIVARALPDVKDGMKPVHRRILFGMSEAGITPSIPHKKSARIVGDVMGKYHPHGDSSIYEAMVRLAQNFSTRYPLVDGHGNFGSIDGDDPAAMRYTEARMSKIALEMVRDIKKDTVDLIPNYDGEDEEPVALPSRFPNILVNGGTGIAVGMATNIPPHNLGETIDATLAIYENPDITIPELLEIIPGPDFPTGAYIMGKSGIVKAYETGQGTIIVRSKCEIDYKGSSGKPRIIVSEIPYGVNKANMITRMGELARDKVIDGLTDIRDESSGEDIRVVIELRKDVVPEVILNQLFKLTQLQSSYGINMLVLVNGEPKVLGIKPLLSHYMDHQFDVVTRRIKFDLARDEERAHILEGLIKALTNIDEVVDTIRKSRNNEDAIAQLSEKFDLSEKQAKAVLGMTLSKLTSLETEKIENECKELLAQINEYKRILADKNEIYKVIKAEMLEIKERFSDKRRSQIIGGEFNIDDEDLIPQEDIIITLTVNGYIKRVPVDTYRTQKRGGRGMKGMSTNEDDVVDKIVMANTHEDVLFFTNFGKVYRIRGHQIPEYSRQSKGIPAINLFKMDPTEKVRSIISIDNKSDDLTDEHTLIFVTKHGITKRVALSEFARINANGKIAVGLKENDELIDVKLTDGNAEIFIASSNGKVVRFNENDIRVMGRTASGVRGINVGSGEVVGVATSLEGKYILVISERGYGKKSKMEDYRLTKRGGQGVLTIKTSEKNGNLAKIVAVNGEEDVLVVTNLGIIIRTSLKEVNVSARNTLGVRIIKLSNNQKVSSLCVTEAYDEEEETPVVENKLEEVVSEASSSEVVESEVNEEIIEENIDEVEEELLEEETLEDEEEIVEEETDEEM
ncbi:MAG: DNA gyrase subunit A [Bacilli bacterium]|nr:DNA gyrase subunit A [Bacilli bacterium]